MELFLSKHDIVRQLEAEATGDEHDVLENAEEAHECIEDQPQPSNPKRILNLLQLLRGSQGFGEWSMDHSILLKGFIYILETITNL